MKFERLYTKDTKDVYSGIQFKYSKSEIKNIDGSVVFSTENVETPSTWSQVATDILAQKYFRKAGIPAKLKKGAKSKEHRTQHYENWLDTEFQ